MSDRPLALVTGGVRRVGLAIGRTLAASGCDLIITYRSQADEAQAAAAELQRYGAAVRTYRLDLDDVTSVDKAGESLAEELRRLDVLVHNASVYAPSPLNSLTPDAVMANYRVNAASPLLLTRRLAGLLSASSLPGGGAVVAMCDMHVLGRPRREFAAYSMSKASLVEMVRVLARELAPGVRVNGVAPGVVAFPESGYESEPAAQQAYLSRVPLQRAGTPEDAAEAVRWLALEARYTTGEIVRVDGGRWLA
ncbi:MAG: SDR family oxidoreductase [Phycisphaeraceae bacterium]|nr:SDR family oxidoreductase [Phycisphaeraceae bacterium]